MTHLQLPDDRRSALTAVADPADAPASGLDAPPSGPAPSPAVDEGAAAAGVLVIRPWYDRRLATVGFDLRSAYVERYWLGVLGPSATMLLRRFARGLEERPDGFQISLADTARAIGLGGGTGRQSPITRTIDRACLFSTMLRVSESELHVRTHLPRLTPRQLSRLPLAVRNSHGPWLAANAPAGPSSPHAA